MIGGIQVYRAPSQPFLSAATRPNAAARSHCSVQVVLLKCIAEIGSQSYHTGNMELFAQHPGE
jgi:hypothetical protein